MKKVTSILLILLLALGWNTAQAQNVLAAPVSINSNGSSPHPSAVLDLTRAGRGLTVPLIDSLSEINNVIPVQQIVKGMLLYVKENRCFYVYNGNTWLVNCFHDGFSLPTPGDTADQFIQFVDNVNNASKESVDNLYRKNGELHKSDMFMASSNQSVALPLANNSSYPVRFDNEHFDTGFNFSLTSLRAQNEGYYYFSSDITFTGGDGTDDTVFLQFDVNGQPSPIRTLIDPQFFTRSGRERTSSISGILYLGRNDVVNVSIYDIDKAGDVHINRRTFSGFFLSY